MDTERWIENTGERRVRKPTSVVRRRAGGEGLCKQYLACCLSYFVILHTDLKELQRTVKRVRQWLATMGLQLNADKTRITHTLTPYQGQAGFDFLGFAIRQEPVGNSPIMPNNPLVMLSAAKHPPTPRDRPFASLRATAEESENPFAPFRVTGRSRSTKGQERSLGLKTIITPSQEASKRHLAAIDQRLQQLQAASQEQVIAELNPLIMGWANYYAGIVDASTMSRYDDLLEQRLINWASSRHPGKARDWLLTRYWHRDGTNRRVFATDDGIRLRGYRQRRILRG